MHQAGIRFNEFELDTENCELRRSGRYVKLERIPLQLLVLLLESPGKLVRRGAIVERLWGNNVFVESEHSINTAVNKLRAILRDNSRNPRFIRTVVGQGYCFIGKVEHPEQSKGSGSGPINSMEAVPDSLLTAPGGCNASGAGGELVSSPITHAGVVSTEPHLKEPSSANSEAFNRWPWIIAGLIASLVLSVIAIYALRQPERIAQKTSQVSALHSIAVLPFRNLAQTSDQDYLVDGITDQLTTSLARSTSLRVISQRSAMQYKGIQKPLPVIAQELHVDAIVEGSYLSAGKEVRITAQLLDARNDRHLWAQTYNESRGNLLEMQDDVTNDMAQQISIALGSAFSRSRMKALNPRAHDAFLRGRYFWNERTPTAVANSIKYYTEAIREDPKYAEAYATLAEAYVLQAAYGGVNPSDSLWKGQYAAERALELDNSLGEAHVALGAIKVERDWDWEGAEKEYERALELSPANPTAHQWYSLHLSRMGRFQEAETEIQRAIALDPLSLMINTDAAETAYWAGNSSEAMKRVEDVLALNPNFAEAHLAKGKILEQLHRYPEAITEYEAARNLFGGSVSVDGLRAHAMAMSGRQSEALNLVRNMESQQQQANVSGIDIALAYCGLGRPDNAMKWLNYAYQRHENGMVMIGIDPLFDGCRSDPNFVAFVGGLGLAQNQSSNHS